MNIRDYIAHHIIGTPFERFTKRLITLSTLPQRMKHPELNEIYVESVRAELAMRKIINSSMNCIDIGAHLGSVLNLINHLSPQGKHIAIEPIPYKYKWLKRKFPNVQIFEVALSDTEGEADFYLQQTHSGFSGLRLRGEDHSVEILKVKLARLDDIVPSDLPIGFIKIDVEGAELAALRGSESILMRCNPTILFECAKSSLKANQVSSSEIYEFFHAHNYRLFLIKDWLSQGEALDYKRFTKSMEYPFQAFNFLAIPQE